MRHFEVGFTAVALAAVVMSSPMHAQDSRDRSGATGKGTTPQSGSVTGARSDSRGFIDEMAIAGMAEVELGKLATDRASDPDVKAYGRMMVTEHSKANDELKQAAARLNIEPTTQLDRKHRDVRDKLSKARGEDFDREYMAAMLEGHEDVLGKLHGRTATRGAGGPAGRPGGSPSDRRDGEDRTSPGATAPGSSDVQTGATGGHPGSSDAGRTGDAHASSDGAEGRGARSGSSGERALTEWAANTLPVVQQHLDKAKALKQKLN